VLRSVGRRRSAPVVGGLRQSLQLFAVVTASQARAVAPRATASQLGADDLIEQVRTQRVGVGGRAPQRRQLVVSAASAARSRLFTGTATPSQRDAAATTGGVRTATTTRNDN